MCVGGCTAVSQINTLGQLRVRRMGTPERSWWAQLVPPLVVTQTSSAGPPDAPIAMQVVVLGQLTEPIAWRSFPGETAAHVAPPSMVVSMVSNAPTAKHSVVLGQLIPKRLFVVFDVW